MRQEGDRLILHNPRLIPASKPRPSQESKKARNGKRGWSICQDIKDLSWVNTSDSDLNICVVKKTFLK